MRLQIIAREHENIAREREFEAALSNPERRATVQLQGKRKIKEQLLRFQRESAILAEEYAQRERKNLKRCNDKIDKLLKKYELSQEIVEQVKLEIHAPRKRTRRSSRKKDETQQQPQESP